MLEKELADLPSRKIDRVPERRPFGCAENDEQRGFGELAREAVSSAGGVVSVGLLIRRRPAPPSPLAGGRPGGARPAFARCQGLRSRTDSSSAARSLKGS
jgi:hypothetical protein